MITIRKSDERGHANHGWLDTRHTFSFGSYFDPDHMGFRHLRVINEDWVRPGHGFPEHGHKDMEILTYVLDGALEHRDSMGNGSVIRPGDVQRMSAGRGVMHSEFNHSDQEQLHLLQIWVLPEASGLDSGYEEKHFPVEERRGRMLKLASRDGGDGSVRWNQDTNLFGGLLAPEEEVSLALAEGRHAWVQVARGSVTLNGERLEAGDGAAVSGERELRLRGVLDAEVLVFDLA